MAVFTFFVGLFVGCFIGIVIMCLMFVAKQADGDR